jgi:hypothetical protein
MQPVVVVVGTLSSTSATYFVVDEACIGDRYMPLKAVDICFKAFHVFHAAYPAGTLFQQLLHEAHV